MLIRFHLGGNTMSIKRFIVVVLFVSFTLFLTGCKDDPVTEYEVTLTSNIEASLTIEKADVINGVQSYTISTSEVEGYSFSNWHTEEGMLLSTQMTIDYTPTEDITLVALFNEDVVSTSIDVTVTSNISDLYVGKAFVVNNDGAKEFTLSATYHEGYVFKHWINTETQEIVSFDLEYVFIPTESISITAVYEEYTVVEPTLYYETSFEDGTKAAYAYGLVTLSDMDWTFEEALLGTLATDLNVDGQSVRIKEGYIKTEFAVSDIAQVIFYAGTYGSDADSPVRFEVSTDATTWITLDTFTATKTMTEYSYVFDDDFVTAKGIDTSNAYYIRIYSETSARTNIDDFSIYTGEGSVVSNDALYSISFTEDMEYQYLIDEVVDLDQCVATHEINGATDCDYIGSVDSSTPGAYEITYYKTDEYNNTVSVTITITVIDGSNDYLSMDLMTYYDDAEGLYGDALIEALHDIINDGFVGVTYGDARYILDDTDVDPNNPNNLILVYLGTSVDGDWDSGITWNREHVWPQSLLGVAADNGTVNMASDLYNLMPANPNENSTRGNDPYSDLGFGYEPRDEVKGDIARALFYMMVMYDELDLVNTVPGVHEMGYLDELISWHYEDPVDDFEMARLEVIFGEQHNRNPFVDYPHFVDLIWYYNNPAE
jgi:endonuclease I